MDPKSDRFAKGLPAEFDERARELWISAQRVAARSGSRAVFPWDFFTAWLSSCSTLPLGLTADEFQQSVDNKISYGPPHEQGASLEPESVLTESFSLALADSYRFFGSVQDVDFRLIIPNLLDGRLHTAQTIAALGFDMKEMLRAILSVLGSPLPDLYGHYMFRLRFYQIKV